jgi:hypothetical protein
MRSALNILLFLIMVSTALVSAQSTGMFFGDAAHPVVSGEVWLVANRWGAYPAVLVATIRNGSLEERRNVVFPQYWEQAEDYKALVGVADHAVPAPESFEVDDAFGTGQLPNFLKRFSGLYLSPPLSREKLGSDWRTALTNLGQGKSDQLVLPRPTRRTIHFLYPDGKPLRGATVSVLLFGSTANHCGFPVGIPLGVPVTNQQGEISFVASNTPLAVVRSYYEAQSGGPAGVAYAIRAYLTTGGDQEITLRESWSLPEYDYLLTIHAPDSKPIEGVAGEACLWDVGCGASCGPIGNAASDSAGVLHFRTEDLRAMRTIRLVDAQGKVRNLDNEEMRTLLTAHESTIVW